MRSTRSGRTYSPYDAVECANGDVELLLSDAFGRSEEFNVDGLVEGPMDVVETRVHASSDGNGFSDRIQSTSSKAEKDKMRRKQRRKAKREEVFWSKGQPPSAIAFKRVMQEAQGVDVAITQGGIANLPASSCGFQALPGGFNEDKHVKTFGDLIDEGYDIIPWDGRRTILLTWGDKKTVIVACVGRDADEGWSQSCDDAYEAFKDAGAKIEENGKPMKHNPRGPFTASLAGIIHGHGSTDAHNIRISKGEEVVEDLMKRKSVIRLANFASASFSMFAPKVYAYYHSKMKELSVERPDLTRPFAGSVFACAGFNMGTQVATYMHRDCMNCPYGWCAVQSLGNFDPKKGGHMVLEDLKVAIEFPAGSLILLPSATLKHGNTAIRHGEGRASFTQFTAGNLFRFIECGFQTECQLKVVDPMKYEELMVEKKQRWMRGIELWSTLSELEGCLL